MCNLRVDELAYQLVSNPWFDRVIITTIIINCFFLALNDPTKNSNEQVGISPPTVMSCAFFLKESRVNNLHKGIASSTVACT